MPVVDAMQDTEMGTSNADISGSTRAIEVSLAQGHSTKRSASNGTIKRGGRIFGQIGQICKAIALQIFQNLTKKFLLQILQVLIKRTPNPKEFLH